MKNNRLIIKLCVLLMLFMAVLQPFSSLEVNAAKGDIEYMKDIAKHHYSYPTTDRDKANDFIFSFYRIAQYHVYADLDKATDEQIVRGLHIRVVSQPLFLLMTHLQCLLKMQISGLFSA